MFSKIYVILMLFASLSLGLWQRGYSQSGWQRGFSQSGLYEEESARFNKIKAGDASFFLGAGYGTEIILDYTQTDFYTAKTKNNIPPLSLGFEYALFNFFSLGTDFIFFRLTPVSIPETPSFNLFLFSVRNIFHVSLSRVTLYAGVTYGFMIYNLADVPVMDYVNTGSLGKFTFSALGGLRIFFNDTFFLFAESSYPFPVVMGGIGIKI